MKTVGLAVFALLAALVAGSVSWAANLTSGVDYSALAKADAAVRPAVKSYAIKPKLANVSNLNVFKKALEPKMISMIQKNGFVVTPTDFIQIYHIYENNEYQRPNKYPAFITTDSMLHTYHVFYDYSLRVVESEKLFDAAVKLSEGMLAASEKDYSAATDPVVKDAAKRNVAFFALARHLLEGKAPPASVKQMVDADMAQISKHQARATSAIQGFKIDFSQFVPRGHYTRTERLKKYFRGMMWYGLTAFPTPQKDIGPKPTIQAILITRNLRNDPALMKLWDKIYEPTAFYVGTADDYTFAQYSPIVAKTYGSKPSLDGLADKAKLDGFLSEVKKLPPPRISNTGPDTTGYDPKVPVGRQFRFMGQRFIPDSRVMQELVDPKVYMRGFPSGLDVLAALGSDRALSLLRTAPYKANSYSGFESQMTKMRRELAQTPPKTWRSNLYWGWLWSLKSIIKQFPAGYPSFMRNRAWLDKSLYTAMGSWTELRHDTILYAKQSEAECGGEGEEEPPQPKGYVEPNLEFWSKMKWLNQATKQGLSSRGLLTAELADKFSTIGDMIDFCRRVTIKELTNQKVTQEEYRQISYYGAELEALSNSIAGGTVMSETDKDMALVADVHTNHNKGKVLEEATGRAAAIWVVVPIQGKLYLTRGAIYTQYEFLHPQSDRLTDEKWQKMLKSGKQPPRAPWVDNFFTPVKKKPSPEFEVYDPGC